MSRERTTGSVVALAGGVGAARFLRGLVRAVPPDEITALVNTGDDHPFYGVQVCPVLDIVIYTLANRVDPERGFGIAGDEGVQDGVEEGLHPLGQAVHRLPLVHVEVEELVHGDQFVQHQV